MPRRSRAPSADRQKPRDRSASSQWALSKPNPPPPPACAAAAGARDLARWGDSPAVATLVALSSSQTNTTLGVQKMSRGHRFSRSDPSAREFFNGQHRFETGIATTACTSSQSGDCRRFRCQNQESPAPFDAGLPGFILLSWVSGQAGPGLAAGRSSPARALTCWPEPESANA